MKLTNNQNRNNNAKGTDNTSNRHHMCLRRDIKRVTDSASQIAPTLT